MTDLIQKYSSILNEIKDLPQVEDIIIFGSTLTNSQTPLSDLDVAIIFRKNTSKEDIIEVLSYGTEELDISNFHNLPLPLQYKIITGGKTLKNSIEFLKLKIRITSEWLEFKPRLKRMYENRGINTENLI